MTARKTPRMTQAQTDVEVVKGWRDCAIAARETTMVAFYERLLAALRGAAPSPDPKL